MDFLMTIITHVINYLSDQYFISFFNPNKLNLKMHFSILTQFEIFFLTHGTFQDTEMKIKERKVLKVRKE